MFIDCFRRYRIKKTIHLNCFKRMSVIALCIVSTNSKQAPYFAHFCFWFHSHWMEILLPIHCISNIPSGIATNPSIKTLTPTRQTEVHPKQSRLDDVISFGFIWYQIYKSYLLSDFPLSKIYQPPLSKGTLDVWFGWLGCIITHLPPVFQTISKFHIDP